METKEMAVPERIADYLQLLREMGTCLGNHLKGEVEIITDPQEILIVEAEVEEDYKRRGFEPRKTPLKPWQVGIVSYTRYFVLVREAVRFSKKLQDGSFARGIYDRMFYTNLLYGSPGICILPITKSSKVVLNVSFRHSTRAWGIEVAGTIALDGEDDQASVSRCISSELGSNVKVLDTIPLGHTVSERGILGTRVPIFAIIVDESTLTAGDNISHNLVQDHLIVSMEEFIEARKKSYIIHRGEKCYFEDAYMDAAIFLANLHGLF